MTPNEAAAAKVAAAWVNPGPNPPYHLAMKNQVRENMPMLSRAIDDLVRQLVASKKINVTKLKKGN